MLDHEKHPKQFLRTLPLEQQRRERERTRVWLGSLVLVTILFVLIVLPCRAQETNIVQYQTLMLRCLTSLPDTLQVFELDTAAEMPYLRPALVENWQSEGRTVYLADSVAGPHERPLPILRYHIEDANVVYAPEGRGRLRRTVTLTMQYLLIDSAGRLATERRCTETLDDVISRRAVEGIESDSYPETQSVIPDAGWARRYLEPAVLTLATAVGVYLFFSIRSGEAESTP